MKHFVVHNEGSDAEKRCQEEQRHMTINASSSKSVIVEPMKDDSALPKWAQPKQDDKAGGD